MLEEVKKFLERNMEAIRFDKEKEELLKGWNKQNVERISCNRCSVSEVTMTFLNKDTNMN